MKKITVKQITTTAVLLAICIASQFFKNASVYITGPIINACLIICTLVAGPVCGIILSIITPVTSFFITGSPIMAAVPMIIPGVMVGNATLVVVVALMNKIKALNGKLNFIPMVVGSVVKAAVMGILISLIIVPNLLPAPMHAKMKVIQLTFSLVQLETALIGSAYAYIIWLPLKKTLK